MPNNCFFDMDISGKPEDIKKFLNLFIYEEDIGKKDGEYFARTFLEEYKNVNELIKDKKEEIEKGSVYINGWCAWSCDNCWVDGYPDKEKGLITMEDACKKYNVEIHTESEESMMGFVEKVHFEDGEFNYESEDFVKYRCDNCGNIQHFPPNSTSDYLANEECCECEKCAGWSKEE